MVNRNKTLILVAIVLVLLGAYLVAYNGIYNYRNNKIEGNAEVVIEKGENALEVGRELKEKNLISSAYGWLFYIWKNGLMHKIQAGEYSVKYGANISEIALILTRGEISPEDNQISVTFPEGWDLKKIKNRLEANGFDVSEFDKLAGNPQYFADKYGFEFLNEMPKGNTVEGYLFPDTYFFATDSNMEMIMKKMLDNFDRKLTKETREEIKRQNKSIHEIITLASIIEREVVSEEDKRLVGGIFKNRLEIGQPLQSCATLAYIIGENKKQYSYEDTQVESNYNTYQHKGLTPGPIANPGISSIMAAVYPEETNYNYFLNNQETGETVFSKTLEEHNINKEKCGL